MKRTAASGIYSRRGFTLIEILLVSGMLIVIFGVLVLVGLNQQKSYLSMDASIQVSEEARRALDSMTRELRGAGGTIPVPTVADFGSVLEFQTALGYNRTDIAGCPANDVCWGALDANSAPHKDWKVRYTVSGSASAGGQLNRLVLDAGNTQQASRVLATKIDGLAARTFFEWDSVNKRVTLHLQVVTPNGAMLPGGSRSSGAITSQVELRN